MIGLLPQLQESLASHMTAIGEHEDTIGQVDQLRQQRTYLEEARNDTKHTVYTLRDRSVQLHVT